MVDFSFMLEQQKVSHACVAEVARKRDIPASVLYGILEQERGKPGMERKNTNGTVDVGATQINTVWIEYFKKKYGVPKERIRDDSCFALDASGYILSKEMIRTGGDLWKSVGNYHSRTPSAHWRYLSQVHPRIVRYHNFLKDSARVR